MEAVEYDTLHHHEQSYWWYRAQREAVLDAVRSLRLPTGSRLLDAGCGSGANLDAIRNACDVRAYGADVSEHAARLWIPRGTHRDATDVNHVCRASVNELPYDHGVFDAVVSVDVLCCEEVCVEDAMREMVRILKPGGGMVLAVPAYQWMLSRHDDAVHCVRRFDRSGLRESMERAGMSVRRVTHLLPTFFPMIAAVRLATRRKRMSNGASVHSDLSTLPHWLNESLLGVARLERMILGQRGAPFGSTILASGRKGLGIGRKGVA